MNLPKPEVENLLIKASIESGKNRWDSKGIGLIDSVIIFSAREALSKVWTLDNKLKTILKKEEIRIMNQYIVSERKPCV
ncbi:MAG: hypothetical protein D8M57_03365 [Candidatus Scalindua sp. AMX11]|nr:MAG: hypothetical protein DWQ00_16625 [Candidatus Scalindua sp.]NOG85906.1 hypothetical protein [Planctomycetota bacterium]RZV96923.1 MAG: hypothetical protein EX341_01705 [Candidatus Scalindua sp. SCAELEC01]TDE66464.1 MAG: hypothetical protein D8M57_03365 [Candidatus Scalindua sp. AMX11]GJQ60922.1 MAG: hypothetical protein SCALA701_37230 [Candidatus Scalindua sp.]